MKSGLFVSHKGQRCGVYQFGRRVFHALSRGKNIHWRYLECDGADEALSALKSSKPDIIVLNYHPATLDWAETSRWKDDGAVVFSIFHEAHQNAADRAEASFFDFLLCSDPTLIPRNPIIVPVPRVTIDCEIVEIAPPELFTVGSFGFATHGKGFDRLCAHVNAELDHARIRVNLPPHDSEDIVSHDYTNAVIASCRRAVTKPGIDLVITQDFLDDIELLQFLAGNTINAFFYEGQAERGISSCTDYALACDRPLAITKSTMFRHLHGVNPSICIEDCSLGAIAERGGRELAPLRAAYNYGHAGAAWETAMLNAIDRLNISHSAPDGRGFNKILDDSSRQAYGAALRLQETHAPDILSRKIERANIQQAFALDTAIRLLPQAGLARILAIGSFEDTAVATLKAMGYRVDEIDPNVNGVDLEMFYRSPSAEMASYDLILCVSVLEHVIDDQPFMRMAADLLAPDGIAVFTVDFAESYVNGDKTPQADERFYTTNDICSRLMPALPDCSLLDVPSWTQGVEDFEYEDCKYGFAGWVFRKFGGDILRRAYRDGDGSPAWKQLLAETASELKAARETNAETASELKAAGETNVEIASELKAAGEANAEIASELKAAGETNVEIASELKAARETNIDNISILSGLNGIHHRLVYDLKFDGGSRELHIALKLARLMRKISWRLNPSRKRKWSAKKTAAKVGVPARQVPQLNAERAGKKALGKRPASRLYLAASALRKAAHGQRDFSRRIRRAARRKLSNVLPLPHILSRFASLSQRDEIASARGVRSFRKPVESAYLKNRSDAAGAAPHTRLPFSPTERRVFYIFVDHTVQCPLNTGLQRVARGIGRGLTASGEQVRYVKWDSARKACVLIDSRERRHLAEWNGPPLSEDKEHFYSGEPGAVTQVIGEAGDLNGWLIVPEVTHITPHPEPVTLDLIGWAKRSGLRTGFVFYDAIPLKREEYSDMSEKHRQYMQEIRLADAVWPISHWSGDDLLSYWRHYECAEAATMPSLTPLLLPAEIRDVERPASADCGDRLILCVGTLCPRKNQLLLIEAFQDYLERTPRSSWQLVLAGHMHPLVADAVKASESSAIRYVGPVSDDELASLYQRCAFTVFASVEEGFGLPILESLWHGKPCICANFGSMAEIAKGGGCLSVDVKDRLALSQALERLIEQTDLRRSLAEEAKARSIPSWRDYAASLRQEIDKQDRPQTRLGPIYFWVDSTRSFPNNSGIQRVTRQLAKSLIAQGLDVIPVVWAKRNRGFQAASSEDLNHLEKWNGPDSKAWSQWIAPEDAGAGAWFVMPELPLHLTSEDQDGLLEFSSRSGIRNAAIFYDAIPWKLYEYFSKEMGAAHYKYMCLLSRFDLIFPISEFSRQDLLTVLSEALDKPQSLDHKILTAPLPGEFPDAARTGNRMQAVRRNATSILCVSALEPRKNIQTLLTAFGEAQKCVRRQLRLTIVGRFIPGTSVAIREAVESMPGVRWLENVDDKQLRELYALADFTVFPSVEEGFGLPIAESLWNAKPCICANFGAMVEIADGGGCLTVDVRDTKQLADAIIQLAENPALREKLTKEAVSRQFKNWQDYAFEIAAHMAQSVPKPRVQALGLEKPAIENRMEAMRLPSRPKLSICISTYNRAEWLAASLRNWEGLYPEPVPGVEMLVCDNASTDQTSEIIEPYLSRVDFSYRRNPVNVGMLGNLRETAHAAKGDYIWILGDDDLMMPGAIERILGALDEYQNTGLVYLNYAYTQIKDARTISDFNAFFRNASAIVPPEPDIAGPIYEFSARNENFFTAIYALVFRRDHALNAYSQDTSGYSFSAMRNCVPTSYYVFNNMMGDQGVWIGEPQLVVNFNVSWSKYASLFTLERIPEVYETAEIMGALPSQVDRWRLNSIPGVIHFFEMIYQHEQMEQSQFFSPARLVRRFRHLPAFQAACRDKLIPIYKTAQKSLHPAAQTPFERVFAGISLDTNQAGIPVEDRKVVNA